MKELEKQAAESKARAAALAEKTAKMEKELAAKRESLTSAASQVKADEAALSHLEGEQTSLAKPHSDVVNREQCYER